MLVAVILCGAGSAWGETYRLVKSVSELEAGSEYLLVNFNTTSQQKALGAVSSSLGQVVDVNISNEEIIISNQNVAILTLGGTTGAWTFSSSLADNKYLAYTKAKGTTKNNNLFLVNNATDNGATWSIVVDDSGQSTITNVYNDERRLQFNTDRFCCYTSNQSPVALYKKAASSAEATTTTINATGITNTDVYTSTAAGSLAATVSADGAAISGASVTWSGNNDAVATINASTGAVTLVSAGTVTFTANYAGVSGEYQASSATYVMTVTDSSPTERFVFSELGYENEDAITSVEGTDVTLTFAAGTNTQNSPKYYSNGYGVRMYNGNTLTIASTKKIAQIEFTFDGNYNTLALATGQAGTLSGAVNSMRTWTGSATSVIFTTSATNRIKTIKVTFESENLLDPELSYSTTEYTVEAGVAFTTPTLTNPHGLTVTYSSSNTDIATVDENTGAVTIGSTPGTVTITASFAGNDTYSYGSASYTITINAVLANIAALTALTDDDDYQVHLTNALVTYIHGNNAYLEDASGAVLLYDCAEGLAVGDKINGTADVTYTVYHNLPEVTAITLHEDYTKTSGNTVTPTEVTIAELNENFTSYISRYVKIVEATVTSAFANRSAEIKQGEASIDLRDQNSTATLTATVDNIVTVTAHPAIYNTTKQIAVYEQSQIVVKPIEKIDPTILVEDASIEFGSSYTIDTDLIEGGDVTATSGTTAVATVNGLVITPIAVGSTVITVTTAENNRYNAGSETFTLTVTQPAGQKTAPTATTGEVMFYETFTDCASTGGNDNDFATASNTEITTANDFTDNDGWSFTKGYPAKECVKFGGSKASGSASSPNITVESGKTYTLTFKAAPWNSESDKVIWLSVTGGTINNENSVTTAAMNTGVWNEFSYQIVATSTSMTLGFSCSANRFFLDEVKIEAPASAAPTESYKIPSSGLGTYCSQYPIDLDELPDGVKAYGVASQSETSVTLTELTGKIKGGIGFIIEGEGNTNLTFTFADSSNEPESLLEGTLAPTYLPAGTAWGLKNGKFQPNLDGTLPAHKAYLPAETSTGGAVKELIIVFNDADGITTTRTITDAATIYDLTGRRLQSTQKGVNIVNGKKILVK